MKTGQNLVDKHKKLSGFTTDLSDDEILALLVEKYRIVLQDSLWEFLRKNATGTIASSEITPPADFEGRFMRNWSEDWTLNEPSDIVVLVGTNPYLITPMGQRNATHTNNFCWYDIVAGKIKFPSTANVNGQTYSFDYCYKPADFTLTTSPVMSDGSEEMLAYASVIEETPIQKSDGARDHRDQNLAIYSRYLNDLRRRNLRSTLIT